MPAIAIMSSVVATLRGFIGGGLAGGSGGDMLMRDIVR